MFEMETKLSSAKVICLVWFIIIEGKKKALKLKQIETVSRIWAHNEELTWEAQKQIYFYYKTKKKRAKTYRKHEEDTEMDQS